MYKKIQYENCRSFDFCHEFVVLVTMNSRYDESAVISAPLERYDLFYLRILKTKENFQVVAFILKVWAEELSFKYEIDESQGLASTLELV